MAHNYLYVFVRNSSGRTCFLWDAHQIYKMLKAEEVESNLQSLLKKINISESTISAVLGALVVVIIGGFGIRYFQELKKTEKITEQAASTVNEAIYAQQDVDNTPETYTVREGDDLSLIAEKIYGDSELWPAIVEENSLISPDLLMVGQVLRLPKLDVDTSKVAGDSDQNVEGEILTARSIVAIIGNSYVVQPGDTLESIAERAYGSTEAWPKISDANGIWSPDFLEAGVELSIPRN